jgi:hypothetical protein
MARMQFVRDRRTMRCASLLILPAAESGGSGSGGVGARARTWTVREWNCWTTSRDAGLVGYSSTGARFVLFARTNLAGLDLGLDMPIPECYAQH